MPRDSDTAETTIIGGAPPVLAPGPSPAPSAFSRLISPKAGSSTARADRGTTVARKGCDVMVQVSSPCLERGGHVYLPEDSRGQRPWCDRHGIRRTAAVYLQGRLSRRGDGEESL